jgi:hypothetical protein
LLLPKIPTDTIKEKKNRTEHEGFSSLEDKKKQKKNKQTNIRIQFIYMPSYRL